MIYPRCETLRGACATEDWFRNRPAALQFWTSAFGRNKMWPLIFSALVGVGASPDSCTYC